MTNAQTNDLMPWSMLGGRRDTAGDPTRPAARAAA